MRGPHTFGPKYTFVLLSFPESCLSPRSLFSQGSAYLNSRICGTWLAGHGEAKSESVEPKSSSVTGPCKAPSKHAETAALC